MKSGDRTAHAKLNGLLSISSLIKLNAPGNLSVTDFNEILNEALNKVLSYDNSTIAEYHASVLLLFKYLNKPTMAQWIQEQVMHGNNTQFDNYILLHNVELAKLMQTQTIIPLIAFFYYRLSLAMISVINIIDSQLKDYPTRKALFENIISHAGNSWIQKSLALTFIKHNYFLLNRADLYNLVLSKYKEPYFNKMINALDIHIKATSNSNSLSPALKVYFVKALSLHPANEDKPPSTVAQYRNPDGQNALAFLFRIQQNEMPHITETVRSINQDETSKEYNQVTEKISSRKLHRLEIIPLLHKEGVKVSDKDDQNFDAIDLAILGDDYPSLKYMHVLYGIPIVNEVRLEDSIVLRAIKYQNWDIVARLLTTVNLTELKPQTQSLLKEKLSAIELAELEVVDQNIIHEALTTLREPRSTAVTPDLAEVMTRAADDEKGESHYNGNASVFNTTGPPATPAAEESEVIINIPGCVPT